MPAGRPQSPHRPGATTAPRSTAGSAAAAMAAPGPARAVPRAAPAHMRPQRQCAQERCAASLLYRSMQLLAQNLADVALRQMVAEFDQVRPFVVDQALAQEIAQLRVGQRRVA